MTPATPEQAQVLEVFEPSVPVYVVLDGARDRRIRPWAIGTFAPLWCLYRGALPDALAAVAPWLLRLGRGHRFTDDFFRLGWGQAWGILIASSASANELRRHLRRFLRVRSPDGKVLLFVSMIRACCGTIYPAAPPPSWRPSSAPSPPSPSRAPRPERC